MSFRFQITGRRIGAGGRWGVKNAALTAAALNAVKCTHFFIRFVHHSFFLYFCSFKLVFMGKKPLTKPLAKIVIFFDFQNKYFLIK